MAESRLSRAQGEITGLLEQLAAKDKEMAGLADEVEDDLVSLFTLVVRLHPEQLRLPDVQDIVAHLLDHVISETWELAEKNEPLGEAMDEYLNVLASRLETKIPSGSRHSRKLDAVFDNYWQDRDGDDEDDGPFDDEEPEEREAPAAPAPEGQGLLPRARRAVTRKFARFPPAADVTGEVEIEGEE